MKNQNPASSTGVAIDGTEPVNRRRWANTVGILVSIILTLGLTAACQSGHNTNIVHEITEDGPGKVAVLDAAEKEVLFSVFERGGYIPVEHNLGQYPSLVIYTDGTVVKPGPKALIYPPPVRAPHTVGKLTETEIQRLLDKADATGLFGSGKPNFGDVLITDMASTLVSVRLAASEPLQSVDVYALIPDLEADAMSESNTQQAQKNRTELLDLITFAETLAATNHETIEIDRYAVFILDPETLAAEITQTPNEWPFGDPIELGSGIGCAQYSNEQVQQLKAQSPTNNPEGLWRSDNTEFAVVLRPMFTPDSGCPNH